MAPATQIPTRDRILFAAAELFRRQGYAGTGLKQVAAQSSAPFGSIYHFFPGGKEQLADEVLRAGGAFFLELYRAIVTPEPDLLHGLGAFFDGAAATVEQTDYQDACPIATVAGEVAGTSDGLRRACADVFELWLGELEADLVRAGATDAAARPAALAILASLEGAFLLCRTLRSVEPMRAAAVVAVATARAAITTTTTQETER